MANDEHVTLLKQGVAAWNAWREKNPDIRPDLSEAILGGADLSGANLFMADLSGAILVKANLDNADLSMAWLFPRVTPGPDGRALRTRTSVGRTSAGHTLCGRASTMRTSAARSS
jgi:hypothetical protein